MKTTKIISLIIISFLLGIGIYCGVQLYSLAMDAMIDKICPPEITCYEATDYPLFVEAVRRIGDRAYDKELYNCVDFSKDLVREFERIGVKSSIAISEERDHAWVVVWIETTSGSFISPGEDLEILELRDKEMRVICK